MRTWLQACCSATAKVLLFCELPCSLSCASIPTPALQSLHLLPWYDMLDSGTCMLYLCVQHPFERMYNSMSARLRHATEWVLQT